jgi:7tm Chemosensory receptor
MFVLQLLWWLNQVFGTLAFRFENGTGLIVKSLGHSVYSFIVALLMIIGYPIAFYHLKFHGSGHSFGAVMALSLMLDYFLYYITAIACLITSAMQRSGIEGILNSLQVIFLRLSKFGPILVDLRVVNKYVLMKSTILSWYTFNIFVYADDSVGMWLAICVSEYIVACAVANTMVVLAFLTAYLQCLDAAVVKLIGVPEMSRPQRLLQVCDEIETFMQIHGEVVDIGLRFQSVFSVQLFCLLSNEFILTFLQVSSKNTLIRVENHSEKTLPGGLHMALSHSEAILWENFIV